jgi:hypothetical protein
MTWGEGPRLSEDGAARVNHILRIAVMVIASAVAAAGALIMAGVFLRERLPETMRIVMGATVSLYGVYKFTLAYFRSPSRREAGEK